MACPTCSHTMARLGCQYAECAGSWACPRCGTLKIGHEGGHIDVIVPALVDRCRQYAAVLAAGPAVLVDKGDWVRLGIEESILPEAVRRPTSPRRKP